MKFNVISSGSKGNITYIESKESKLLIDAGISLKEIKNRADVELSKIDAIFITHEHIDHVSNLISLAKTTNAIVYINKDSYQAFLSRNKSNKEKVVGLKLIFIEANKKYKINDVYIYTLMLSHDTASCLGYIISDGENSIGYITDTGFLPIPYIEVLKKVDCLIIEANHDIELLNNSSRPWFLKERILSVKGHMSNLICGQIVNTILSSKKLKVLVLAHLSEECNTEEIAIDTILNEIKGDYIPKIMVAKQREATGLIGVNDAC